jgi:hypothetical protein
MCTLTVFPRDNGYRLGMNRDEKIARGAGLPPFVHDVDGTGVIYPSDGDGGTWIGVNEHRSAFALLNWNDAVPASLAAQKTRSRGSLIPRLIGLRVLKEVHCLLADQDLDGVLAFRLVGVFLSEKEIGEWRWNSARLEFVLHRWEARHWFSSSLSDEQAGIVRSAACLAARTQPDAGSAEWLRRLHASHSDLTGRLSLCVHRTDVRTLSYSEIECGPFTIRMRHSVGSPCTTEPGDGKAVGLVPNDISRQPISTWNEDHQCPSN